MKVIKKFLFPIIVVIISVVFIVSRFITLTNTEQKLADKERELNSLKAELDILKQNSESEKRVVLDTIMGEEEGRIESDTETIKTFCSTLMTWSSNQTYEAARYAMTVDYGLPEDCELLTEYMPPIVYVGPKENDDSYLSRLGLNSKFESARVYFKNKNAAFYTYFVEATWSSAGSNGGESFATTVLEISIDLAGNIKIVKPYIMAVG